MAEQSNISSLCCRLLFLESIDLQRISMLHSRGGKKELTARQAETHRQVEKIKRENQTQPHQGMITTVASKTVARSQTFQFRVFCCGCFPPGCCSHESGNVESTVLYLYSMCGRKPTKHCYRSSVSPPFFSYRHHSFVLPVNASWQG